ncbi:hypothetical protein TL16_g00787 [Triparma laevis f. inornata]|uniref:Protein kinase domain-containing protein n=1 Tax=Triparma laevis f. inornata TaxID=1714386 RepID=A0A9W7DNS0_9STRA|nr:hypothetical protein TL16_g00787 [Triparma laevis f. inornata]
MRMRRISTGSLSGVGARADLPTDLTIDRFSNIQAVGSGEYANVFKATWEDGADGNWIALKVLKKEHKGKESVYADFFAEEQVLSKLCGTQHIVEIKGAGLTEDDRPFMVLEMLKEKTLAGRYLREGSWKKRLQWALDLAEALAGLQSGIKTDGHMVFHRDLKPTNIGFENQTDSLKLLDFGLVCAVHKEKSKGEGEVEGEAEKEKEKEKPKEKGWFGGTGKEKEKPKEEEKPKEKEEEKDDKLDKRFASSKSPGGAFLYDLTGNTGSLRYMSPEVAWNKPYNEKSEVYSWAVVTWQIVERRVPFAMHSHVSMGKSVHAAPFARDAMTLELWPYGLDELIQKSWSHDMDARPSFPIIVKALRKIIEHEGAHGPENRTRAIFPVALSCFCGKPTYDDDNLVREMLGA